MFTGFSDCHAAFQQRGLDDPLRETLHLFDLLSNGALRDTDLACLNDVGLDLASVANRRREGVPMEYILGRATFMGLALSCTSDTLIPRQETELLVGVALDLIRQRQQAKRDLTVVDIGTGCGNIAVAIALNTEHTRVLASDISADAVEVAQANVTAYGLQERVSLFCGDLLVPFQTPKFEGQVDVVVCNPPYIPTSSLTKLDPQIVDHEPTIALDAGSYGIDIFRRLIAESTQVLRPAGALVFEIGAGQERLVQRLFQRSGAFEDVQGYDDGMQIRVFSACKRARQLLASELVT